MDKQYRHLINQQYVRDEVTLHICETLENHTAQKKTVKWKIILATAIIVMMIPLTVLAADNILGTPKVKLGKLGWHENPNGYSVRFDNLNSFPLDAFPKEIQTLTKLKRVPYSSWENAEEALGIDLLNNTFLSKSEKIKMRYDDIGYTHSSILYNEYEGQLFYASVVACYKVKGLQVDVKAKITVEHPSLDEETKQLLHGVEGVFAKPDDVETKYEEYTTDVGIPTVILHWDLDYVTYYTAVLAVNDVSYELTVWDRTPSNSSATIQLVKDVLDGFQLK